MVPSADMSNLPPSYQALDGDCVNMFLNADRGNVRRGNDGSFDARARWFIDWCKSLGVHEHHLLELDDAQCVRFLATYISRVKLGESITHKKVMGDTLRQYLSAAHARLEVLQRRTISIQDPHSMSVCSVSGDVYFSGEVG